MKESGYYIRREENEWLFINWLRVCDIATGLKLKVEWRKSKLTDDETEYIAFCNPCNKSIVDTVIYSRSPEIY